MGNRDEKGKGIKFLFYFMSLWILFVLIFILTFNITTFFCIQNVVAIISLLCAISGLVIAYYLKKNWSGVTKPPREIESIKNENYEYLTFLTTYIIPLICIDFHEIRYIIVLVILLVITGIIFIRMDLYCGNPTLALMGYRLYRAKFKDFDAPDGVLLISTGRLSKNSHIAYIPIDTYVWIAKEIKNDN